MIDSPGIVTPTTSQVPDALAEHDEHVGLLQALMEEARALPPAKLNLALKGIQQLLVRTFPADTAAQEIAMLITLIANICADDLMSIERAAPISDPGRDGRVKAAVTFFERLIKRAVGERVMASRLDAAAASKMAKLNGLTKAN